jgi:general secretion pathway protein C
MTGVASDSLSLATTQFVERIVASRWTPLAANLLAATLLAYSLAQWTWQLFTPPPAVAPPGRMAVPVDNTAELRTLLAAQLFGQAAAPVSGQFSPDRLPLTSLNVELTGIVLRGADSFALIRSGAEELAVGIGQEVQPGTTLHTVYPDRVVLQRAGALELLMLKDSDQSLPAGSVVSAVPPPGANPAVTAAGNQFTVNRDSIMQQMQRPDFLSQALLVPNSGGGFLVREIQAGSVYEKLGVRAGDVIRNINGQPVNNVNDVMRIYQQLGGVQQAGRISIEVARAGRSETLQYTFE